MEITEVRIKLMEDPSDRLSAFCSITLDDCFVIRDLKIIQGAKGAFVAMPSRKLSDRCPKCHTKNQIRAVYCNQCGVKLNAERALKDEAGRAKLYADIAHPINSICRDMIQKRVIEAFDQELIRSQESGYTCSYDEYEEERFATLNAQETNEASGGHESKSDSSTTEEQVETPVLSTEQGTQESTEVDSVVESSPRSTLNLETEDGKLLRVDSHSIHEANSPERKEAPVSSPNVKSSVLEEDTFGDGII